MLEAEASLLPLDETVIRRMPTIPLAIGALRDVGRAAPAAEAPPTPREGELSALLSETERREYEKALARCGGNVSKAARALGVSRGTLYNKMRRYGLVPEKD